MTDACVHRAGWGLRACKCDEPLSMAGETCGVAVSVTATGWGSGLTLGAKA